MGNLVENALTVGSDNVIKPIPQSSWGTLEGRAIRLC